MGLQKSTVPLPTNHDLARTHQPIFSSPTYHLQRPQWTLPLPERHVPNPVKQTSQWPTSETGSTALITLGGHHRPHNHRSLGLFKSNLLPFLNLSLNLSLFLAYHIISAVIGGWVPLEFGIFGLLLWLDGLPLRQGPGGSPIPRPIWPNRFYNIFIFSFVQSFKSLKYLFYQLYNGLVKG